MSKNYDFQIYNTINIEHNSTIVIMVVLSAFYDYFLFLLDMYCSLFLFADLKAIMQREISTFPLQQTVKVKLMSAGFVTVDDVLRFKPSELSKVLSVSLSDSLELQQSLGKAAIVKALPSAAVSTAWDLMLAEKQHLPIVTFSECLDNLLGGGVPRGTLTEFAGAPGVGKTQLCIQLAVDVQIPECFGGVEGEAVYIDTEGSFIIQRVVDIAKATYDHCMFLAGTEINQDLKQEAAKFTVESILSGIHYVRCHDHVELMATMHSLFLLLKAHPKVRLIIVDSIAFTFRFDCEDFSTRTRLLNLTAQTLSTLAVVNGLAVVVTNQMTTHFGNDKPQLIPALGESWGHSCATRVVLHWQNEQRRALLYKSPSRKEADICFQITTAGVRDI